ncbi:MAG: GatB/YqeY domain-containing protein [Proteobacteria bacterium]|jgi:uncharacterized protein YqeY|nr:GatB/YqeY domain-containing protein [Pseudomonadota bacterium]
MELKARLQKSMTEAMKAKDASRLQSIRLMWNALRKREIDDRKDLSDQDIEKILLTMIKQSTESLEQAKSAGRADLQAEVEKEISIIKEFLPEQMSEADVLNKIKNIVADLKAKGSLPEGAKAMGMVMKEAMAVVGSKAEGRVIQAAVKSALGL